MAALILSFDDLGHKDKAVKELKKYFKRSGNMPVRVDIDPKVKRSSGVSYREASLTFSDSQIVKLRFKREGDIFQVLLNKTIMPIQHQDDHVKAIGEITQAMERGRSTFQRRLARARVKLPAGIKTAAPRMEKQLEEKRDALKESIEDAKQQLADLATGAA